MIFIKSKTAEYIHKCLEFLNIKFSIFGNKEFYDVDCFPWVKRVEENASEIKQELEFLLKNPDKISNLQNIFKQEEFLCSNDKWKSFVLKIADYWIDEHVKLCPITCQTLKLIPGSKTAFFSILKANEEIPMHRGYYNGLLRYHLAVKVSNPEKCGIVVGDSLAHWQEGKSLVFDDTFFHYAWNHSDDYRVILFVDFKRPLYFPMNIINSFLLRVFESLGMFQEFKDNSDKNVFAK
jgi:beta-hydroxylase